MSYTYRGIYMNHEGWTSSNWSRLVYAHGTLAGDFPDIDDYYPGTLNLYTHGLLQITGELSPDTTGTYFPSGTYSGKTKYKLVIEDLQPWWIWWHTSGYWMISTAAGNISGNYWYFTSSDPSPVGVYTPFNGAAGTATVSAHTEGDFDPGGDDYYRDTAHDIGIANGSAYATGADFLAKGNYVNTVETISSITKVSTSQTIELDPYGYLYYPGSPTSYAPTQDVVDRHLLQIIAPLDLSTAERFNSFVHEQQEFTVEIENIL